MVKYRNHPCIIATRELSSKTLSLPPFSFSNPGRKEILLEITVSVHWKDTDIPNRIIKIDPHVFTDFIHSSSTRTSKVCFFLKLVSTTPVFKKEGTNLKVNYRPVSILPNISKIFKQCMFEQLYIYNFTAPFLSKSQCIFRERDSSPHLLLAMIKKWWSTVNKRNFFPLSSALLNCQRRLTAYSTNSW